MIQHRDATLQPTKRLTCPHFKGTLDIPAYTKWAVDITVQSDGIKYQWCDFAHDSQDAKRRALDHARRIYEGRSFVVRATYQVTA